MIEAIRSHDICAGHRVLGHENKCRHLHGHNYRVHFHCAAEELDRLGRVIDFGVIKTRLCDWLEVQWDHRTLIFCDDPWLVVLQQLDPQGVVSVPFNPTAENMAQYLVESVGPNQLLGTGVTLRRVDIEETRKCQARYQL